MKTFLIAASLALAAFAFAPTAGAVATCVLPPVSQFQVCVAGGCAVVDGPAMHREACPGDFVADIDVCTPGVSQFQACVGLPCSVIDGPAMHRVVCLPVLS